MCLLFLLIISTFPFIFPLYFSFCPPHLFPICPRDYLPFSCIVLPSRLSPILACIVLPRLPPPPSLYDYFFIPCKIPIQYFPLPPSDGYVQPVKETECVNKSDVTVVVIILSVFLFLLLVIATILGAMVLRSRQKVAGLGFKGREFEPPMHTMSMPRLEINSSGYGSSVGSHGV